MPTRYNAQKVATAQKIKQKIINQTKSAIESSGSNLSGKSDPSWEHLIKYWPQHTESPGPCKASSSEESASDATKSTESASEVSCTAESDGLTWLLDKGCKGKLHLASPSGGGHDTQCGRTLRAPAIGFGRTAAVALGSEWSPRCYAMLPGSVRKAWPTEFRFNGL